MAQEGLWPFKKIFQEIKAQVAKFMRFEKIH